jgi:hypothetical protein
MKTDELIAALAADTKTVSKPINRQLWIAIAGGAIVATLIFLLGVGPRPDIAAALETPRFLYNYVLTLTLLASAVGLMLHLARPGAVPAGWLAALAIPPALLVASVIAEIFLVPSPAWSMNLMGKNAVVCLVVIPLLSAAPLAAVMWTLRDGAPTHPVLAGAVAGLVAAGIGATLYATHCQDDSPFFIAAWYGLAIMMVTAVGAFLGARLLRW